MLNLLERAPHWLRAILKLQDHEVPQHLDTSTIVPVVDVLQGGWGDHFTSNESITAGAGAQLLLGFDTFGKAGAQSDASVVVLAFTIHGAAAGGPGPAWVWLWHRQTSATVLLYYNAAVTNGQWLGTNAIMPERWVIPPGWDLRVEGSAGFNIDYFATATLLPGGVRPF